MKPEIMPQPIRSARAYSILTLKSVNEDERVILGIATTPDPDRMDDIVEPKGAEFSLPIPFLWQHDSEQPIGHVTSAKVGTDGIEVRIEVVKITEPGTLKDRIDEAWQTIKAGLVRGLSIGFSAVEYAFMDNGGIHFMKWNWLELSAVTIPANASATIQTIKSCDTGRPAATGNGRRVVYLSGASDNSRTKEKTMTKPILEQIKGLEATRASKSARLDEIQAKVSDEGRTKDLAEKEEFNTLKGDITALDDEIKDLRELEAINKASAKQVAGGDPDEGTKSRGGHSVIALKKEEPKGIGFTRAAMCVMAAKGSLSDALMLAKAHYPEDKAVHALVTKTAVTSGTTADGGGPLLQYQDTINEFIEFLRSGSILGKFGVGNIPGLHRIGFNTRTSIGTAGASGFWVGQGKPSPLSKATFSTVTLDFAKVASIAVLTQEEVRFVPASEMRIREELARACNARLDQDFIDPTNAGSAGVKPASILSASAAVVASGSNAAAVQTDFAALMGKFASDNLEPASPVIVMSKTLAINLSLMLTSLGQPQYPSLTMDGGTLFGIPVIVSQYLNSLGSPGTGMIALVDANEIFLADDGNVSIEASNQASLEMDGAPSQDGTTGGGASMVSLWQSGLLGLKAQREISWKLRRTGIGAYYISNAAYSA